MTEGELLNKPDAIKRKNFTTIPQRIWTFLSREQSNSSPLVALPIPEKKSIDSRCIEYQHKVLELMKQHNLSITHNLQNDAAFLIGYTNGLHLDAKALQETRPHILFSTFPPVKDITSTYNGTILNLQDMYEALRATSPDQMRRIFNITIDHVRYNNFLAEIMQSDPHVSVVRYGDTSAPFRYGAYIAEDAAPALGFDKWPEKPISWWKVARSNNLKEVSGWGDITGRKLFVRSIADLERDGYVTADFTEHNGIVFSDHTNIATHSTNN